VKFHTNTIVHAMNNIRSMFYLILCILELSNSYQRCCRVNYYNKTKNNHKE